MAAVEQEVVDKIIHDLKMAYERSLEELRDASHEQLKQAQGHAEARIDDLIKQNDGLLGAVGRLQGEKEQAAKKLEAMETDRHQMKIELQVKLRELCAQQDREREELTRERVKHKAEIADLKAKLKKQGK